MLSSSLMVLKAGHDGEYWHKFIVIFCIFDGLFCIYAVRYAGARLRDAPHSVQLAMATAGGTHHVFYAAAGGVIVEL
jgi:hypothetical protein